jgi:hypothetical protein
MYSFEFLGHHVSEARAKPIASYVEAVEKRAPPPPLSIKERQHKLLQEILAQCGWHADVACGCLKGTVSPEIAFILGFVKLNQYLKGLSGEIQGGSKVISINSSRFWQGSRRYDFAKLSILIF